MVTGDGILNLSRRFLVQYLMWFAEHFRDDLKRFYSISLRKVNLNFNLLEMP